MRHFWIWSLVVCAPLAILACKTDGSNKSRNPEPNSPPAAAAKVSYDNFVKGWLEKECTSCHSPDGDSPDLSTYELAKQHASAILSSIQDKKNPMPKGGPLPPKDIVDKIKAWVKAGKPKALASTKGDSKTGDGDGDSDGTDTGDTTPGGTTPGGTTPGGTTSGGTTSGGTTSGGTTTNLVTYENFMRGWISDNCTSCHSPGNQSPDLSTYQGARAAAQESLLRVRSTDPSYVMPPGRAPAAAEIVQRIQLWIDGGYRER